MLGVLFKAHELGITHSGILTSCDGYAVFVKQGNNIFLASEDMDQKDVLEAAKFADGKGDGIFRRAFSNPVRVIDCTGKAVVGYDTEPPTADQFDGIVRAMTGLDLDLGPEVSEEE